ncbi:MAG: hypothetical protein IGS23_19225 [Rivularia sp. T60_A2020_040]|nr:hypothetical protein [Rivularia sp. T60_A2020_040]
MSQFTLTFIDTTDIQGYVFSSNRLRENIGASYLVSAATGEWVEESLEKLGILKDRQTKAIESSNCNAELIYSGGGNVLIIFKSKQIAIEFTQILSRKALLEAPGLNLLVAHQEFDWDTQKLYQVIQDLVTDKIERQKHERIVSAPLLGLGVTASCNSTLLPAIDKSDNYINYEDSEEEKIYLISRETKQKLIAARQANKKLENLFQGVVNPGIYQFPYRTDNLGRTSGESSYVAVIHADGNGMGKRFKKHGDGRENRDYINAMRELSRSIQQAGEKALIAVSKTIINSISQAKVVGKLGEFSLKGQYYLPFRPLVYGGDDTTFVCEGRLGLELAALYLRELEKEILADGEKLTACAGICVVKTHYPFAQAYEISEALCREAKKFVKEKKQFEPQGFSALDWHLAASSLSGSISEIRQREYQIKSDKEKPKKLNMRPVRLNKHDDEWRTWEGFTGVIRQFNEDEKWRNSYNKIMDLRDVLRQGSLATQEFIRNTGVGKLPSFPKCSKDIDELARNGWLDDECGYFDAIEAMEFYLGLDD